MGLFEDVDVERIDLIKQPHSNNYENPKHQTRTKCERQDVGSVVIYKA